MGANPSLTGIHPPFVIMPDGETELPAHSCKFCETSASAMILKPGDDIASGSECLPEFEILQQI